MSDMNHPITGDKKYHSKNNPLNRMGLHASSLKIIHPITKKEMCFIAKTPLVFKNMFDSGMNWSDAWITFSQQKYNYDENFLSVTEYIKNNKIS